MARTGFPSVSGNEGTRATYSDTDHSWLTIIAAGGYVIILGVMLATYLLGDAMPDKTVSYRNSRNIVMQNADTLETAYKVTA